MRRFATLLALSLPMTSVVLPVHAQRGSSGQVTMSRAFDDWLEGVMDEWRIPGIAVGAIKDGEIVHLKGYGYRNESRDPVTPQTLMAIGSNSKSFTVVLMGQMVDEGMLDWDKPVKHYLPDFQLWDDYATENLRVKDLVTHVSGLPRHDALWYGRSDSRPELYQKLRYLEPSETFRGEWQYQNLMFMTAGYLLEEISGRTWDDLVDERIFRPLAMGRSNTSVTDMPGSGDHSRPYVLREDGEMMPVPFRNIDNVGPAGSINSSVEEMVNYIQMHIDLGEWNAQRILSEKNSEMMQTPQSVVGGADFPELGPSTYGLATWVSSYRGHKWVQHGGGIDGFISQMAWLPNDNIGVMVLSNRSGTPNPVPNIVVRRVFDELLGLEPIDWNARTREQVAEGIARRDSIREVRAAERITGTSPSHRLSDYAGSYEHPGYGTVTVSVRQGALSVSYDQFTVALKHFHFDVFEIDNDRDMVPLSGRVQFRMNDKGQIHQTEIPFESNVSPIVFERIENN